MKTCSAKLLCGALAGLVALGGCGSDRAPASDAPRERGENESPAASVTSGRSTSTDVDRPLVTVVSVPPAEVFGAEGALIGNTPLEVPADAHLDLRLRARGYLERAVRIDESTPARLELQLVPDPAGPVAAPVPALPELASGCDW